MKDERHGSLVPMDDEGKGPAWSGDEHRIKVAAAKEVGLDAREEELDSYTEGFKGAMVVQDPQDKTIVLSGRTVLKQEQMAKSIGPMLRFLKVPRDQVALQIHDGEFVLRVSAHAAENAPPTLDSAKIALQLWFGTGLIGMLAYHFGIPSVAGIVWGLGLLVGGWTLRQGLVSGRAMLAARLAVGLGMLAQEEQLILPPASKDSP